MQFQPILALQTQKRKDAVMPSAKLKIYLDSHHVKYVTIRHSPAFTAQEVAASVHLSGKELVKSVMVWVDGKIAMVVLPANRKVILQDLRARLNAKEVKFATEAEFKNQFPDCETGAMPPFGHLYGMEIYAAPSLAEDTLIAFNAGTHAEVIQMAYGDFERLAQPKIIHFTT